MFETFSKKSASSNKLRRQGSCSQSDFKCLGNQSMLEITSQEPAIQRARFMRAVASEGSADTDILLLQRLVEAKKEYDILALAREKTKKNSDEWGLGFSADEVEVQAKALVTIKELLDGYAGMPSSLHIPGTRCIYPVGYQLEITEASDVLANFKRDGNTGTGIRVNSEEGNAVICGLLETLKVISPESFSDIEKEGKTGLEIYDLIMAHIEALNIPGHEDLFKQVIAEKSRYLKGTLVQWFHDKGDPDSYKGSGVKTKEDIYGAEIPDRYGESDINAKIADVRLAWYDDTDDDYYNGLTIDDNWKKGKEGFIENRAVSAQNIINKVNAATGQSLPVNKVSDLNA